MIDIEQDVYNVIAPVIREQYPKAFVTGEYVPAPVQFPAVSIVEMDNTALTATQDSASLENDVSVMYEVNVYSNRITGKKAECKAIAALIDEQFMLLGFTRSFLNPIPNLNDATIYRMTGRYRAVVSDDQVIYRP